MNTAVRTLVTCLATSPLVAFLALSTGCAAFSPVPSSTYSARAAAAWHNPAFDQTRDDREAAIAKSTAGFTKAGDVKTGKLESFQPVPISMKRGRCYTMVLRLDDGAAFSAHARQGVGFTYLNGDRGMTVNGGPGVVGPGGVGSGGCPQADANATFDLQAISGSAFDKSHIHELGTGGYSLELYEKPISDAQLAALRADEHRQIEEQKRFQEEEDRKKAARASTGCRRCQDDAVMCVAQTGNRNACERERDSCAFREAGLSNYRQCQ